MSSVHAGTPPNEWKYSETHVIHFHNFDKIPGETGYLAESPTFNCFNRGWKIKLYPGGREESDRGYVGVFLKICSGPATAITRFSFVIRNIDGDIINKTTTSAQFEVPTHPQWGWSLLADRDAIMNCLTHGTLSIEVGIMSHQDDCICPNFIPANNLGKSMMRLFMDEVTSDVLFEVKDKEGNSSSSASCFHAHKFVLYACAEDSTLASLCGEYHKPTPIPIVGIDPLVFHKMLYYLYGGAITPAEWKDHAKEFIDAGDRLGVRNFKIEAEAWHAKHLEITIDNVIDTFSYAEGKSCFLIKELASDFILKNAKEVIASPSFDTIVQPNIMKEIILVASMNYDSGTATKSDGLAKLSINELRSQLYAKGKDFDGPRGMLIAQLEAERNEEQKSLE